jgi:endonuclease YncB( thermonuclease family)
MMAAWMIVGMMGGKAEAQRKPESRLILDEREIRVRWLDGDTFHSVGRPKIRARLSGYNTLEDYGPVHRWGDWKPEELDRLNEIGTSLARSKAWSCRTMPTGGGYGRALIRCEGLAKALISRGLAHTYSVKGSADPTWNALQQEAQRKRLGMWKKGVPEYIVTSVHSAGGRRPAYIRMISTKDGSSKMINHSRRYRACEWVCKGGSCMMYIPFKQRYGARKASCIR